MSGPISESGKRHAEEVAKVQAEKPSSFTVGAFVDGRTVGGQLSFDRKWSNGWGLTAYARAWWNDAAVIPVATPAPKGGFSAGADASFKF
jgi:hypothetical protein